MENNLERKIADAILNQLDGDAGEFGVEVEDEDYTIYVYGNVSIFGSHEYDCDFVIGQWVAESAHCNIMQHETYDRDGFLAKGRFFVSEVENIVEREILN